MEKLAIKLEEMEQLIANIESANGVLTECESDELDFMLPELQSGDFDAADINARIMEFDENFQCLFPASFLNRMWEFLDGLNN